MHRRQFCKRGHDTFIVDNYKNGRCILCVKIRQNEQKGRRKLMQHKAYLKNKIKRRKHQDKYDKIHAKQIAIYRKLYKENNREKLNAWLRQYRTKKFINDPIFKLTHNLRGRLAQAVKNGWKSGSAIRDLGCSIEFLKQYIESKFYANMTWDNWGEVWELDHIKPLFRFDLTDREQFLIACNYKNLQPLTIEDHRKKTIEDIKC
jgi:hypothetical protein